MDLADSRARPIHVQFKLLEEDTPKGVDEIFSEPFLAQFRPANESGLFTVTLPGRVAEQLMASQKAEPGSFSDFVWTFDAVTGEVVSAAVSGVLNQTLDFGFFRTKVDAQIEIRMNTLAPAGEGKPRKLLGHKISKYCESLANDECRLHDPVDYDSGTGLVEAVGSLSARTRVVTTRTFAPLGKAIFSEVPEDRLRPSESASLPSVSAREIP